MADYNIKYNTKDMNLDKDASWGEATEVKPVSDLKYSGKFGDSIWAVNAVPNSGKLTYRVHCIKGEEWLDEVDSNDNDGNKTYAGKEKIKIDAFAIKSDSHQLVYRVHLKDDNKWLNWVMEYDIEDDVKGYAGQFGKEIDAIQIMPLPSNNNNN